MSVDMPGKVTMHSDAPPQAHPIKAIFTAGFWKSMFNDSAHATGDVKTMPASKVHIDALVDNAVDAAISGDVKGARAFLGQATHTAEDRPFHQGINVFKHLILSVLDFITAGIFDLDPDKVTSEKRQAGIESDINMVYQPFSQRLRESVGDPARAKEIEDRVKGRGAPE
jgi:hypothetical protein